MTAETITTPDIEPGQSYGICRFQPGDAEGVARLFYSVYGSGYPVRTYLEAELLIRENEAQHIISSVARTRRGDIIGHTALFNSAPHSGTYEYGAGLVHTAYRGGKKIFTQLAIHSRDLAATLPGVDAAFGEPVCNHPFSQKLMGNLGFPPSSLEVDLMPAEAYVKEASASGRVAAFLNFKTYRKKPHTVYLPRVYAKELPFFYEGLDDERDFLIAENEICTESDTDLKLLIFDFAGVARIAIHAVGRDFLARIEALEKELQEKNVLVIQIWLNFADTCIGKAVEILRLRGYFLGGILPRWFDTDGLLMQKIRKHPDWDGIYTHTDRYGQILKMVRSDWERSIKEKHDGY
ncbi:MAG: hypothetical protein KKC46_18085 [Proteobacteria bacterium]|nr:hypothetical protein [Pseudomonadota bacterium]